MPAKSKSQQRLFGMVHAFNKGEFQGSRSLRNRLSALSKHIPDTDAKHFAQTPHKGLPEKTAQIAMTPDELKRLSASIPPGLYAEMASPRSRRRRSLLGQILRGTAAGTAIGGLGAGAVGAFLARKALATQPLLSPQDVSDKILATGLRTGLWGAGKGALVGSITGLGLNILDKVRGD